MLQKMPALARELSTQLQSPGNRLAGVFRLLENQWMQNELIEFKVLRIYINIY